MKTNSRKPKTIRCHLLTLHSKSNCYSFDRIDKLIYTAYVSNRYSWEKRISLFPNIYFVFYSIIDLDWCVRRGGRKIISVSVVVTSFLLLMWLWSRLRSWLWLLLLHAKSLNEYNYYWQPLKLMNVSYGGNPSPPMTHRHSREPPVHTVLFRLTVVKTSACTMAA